MKRELRGLSVVITGASSGIGAALARALAREGARLVLAARREDRLAAVADECRKLGGEAIPWRTDVTVRRDVELAVGAAVEQYGGLDAIVNNAGRGLFEPVETLATEKLREVLDVNLVSALHGVQAAIPHLRARGRGQIVFVGSVVGKRGIPRMFAYSGAKAALGSLAECLRVELAGSGIDVTLVMPASTETEFHGAARAVSHGTHGRGPRGYVQSAETVAESIVRAMRRPRREVYPSPGTHLFAILNEVVPGVVDYFMRRAFARRPPEGPGPTGSPPAP